MESAKLMKANSDGRPDQALKIIENHLDTGGKAKLAASPLALSKIVLKRARWMVELERYAHKAIMMQFNEARQLAKEYVLHITKVLAQRGEKSQRTALLSWSLLR
jgi:hypothetical protein